MNTYTNKPRIRSPFFNDLNSFIGPGKNFFDLLTEGYSHPDLINRSNYKTTDEDDHVLLELAIPGVNKGDIEIEAENNNLTVRVNSTEGNSWSKDYTNKFSIDQKLDTDALKASLKNGILSIMIPKKVETIPKRIQIK